MTAKSHALAALTQNILHHLKFFEERIIMQRLKVDGFVRLLRNVSPKAVLEKGYAIIRNKGAVLMSTGTVHTGDTLNIQLKDGELDAEVL